LSMSGQALSELHASTGQRTMTDHTRKLLEEFAAQASNILELFEELDGDGSGYLSIDEFVGAMVSKGLARSSEDATSLFQACDKDQSGELTFRELKEALLIASPLDVQSIGTGALDVMKLQFDAKVAARKPQGACAHAFSSLGTMLGVLAVCAIPPIAFALCYLIGAALYRMDETLLLSTTESKRTAALAHLTAIVPIALMLIVASRLLLGRSTDRFTGLIVFVAILAQSYAAALEVSAVEMVPFVHYYFRLAIAFAALLGWMAGLQQADAFVVGFMHSQDEMFLKAKPVRKWVAIMEQFCSWGIPGKDAYYSFQTHSTAADVLHEMWIVLRTLAVSAGVVMFLTFYLFGASDALSDDPGFDWQEILFFIVFACGSLLLYIGCTADACRNLFNIALAKPFYLGEIIHLHDADSAGGLGKNVTGFVENFTFHHIVIRGFDLKQVWISHGDFQKLTVTNWTRRPTKLLRVQIAIKATSDPQAVRKLLEHIKGWIDSNENVQPKSFRKVALKSVDPGYVLNVIAYPKVGFSKTKLRVALLFDVMEAAKKLKLTLTALEVPQFHVGPVGQDDNDVQAAL